MGYWLFTYGLRFVHGSILGMIGEVGRSVSCSIFDVFLSRPQKHRGAYDHCDPLDEIHTYTFKLCERCIVCMIGYMDWPFAHYWHRSILALFSPSPPLYPHIASLRPTVRWLGPPWSMSHEWVIESTMDGVTRRNIIWRSNDEDRYNGT